MPELRRPRGAGRRRLQVLPGDARDGQLSVLLRPDVRGGDLLPHLRHAARANGRDRDRHARCPACRGTLGDVRVGDTAMLECGRCRGVWVDAATFEHICANREAQAAVLHQCPGGGGPGGRRVRYRKCVACGKMMNRLNFGRLSGTIVDVCRGHGTFLDAGELHRIVRFIQGGGLDRARQRQIEELKDEERRLRSAQAVRQTNLGEPAVEPSWSGVDLLSLLDHLTRR